jgi:methyl-accepting chemotaxis protein
VKGDNEMGMVERIDAALLAHGEWRSRLKKAIDEGLGDIVPAKVKLDDQCAFGKWLYGEGIADIPDKQAYDHIRNLHAQFHQAAGSIADLIAVGDRMKAGIELGFGGSFAKLSADLERALGSIRSE